MDPAVLDRVLALGPAPADLVLVGQGDRVGLMGLVAPVVLVPPRLVGRAGPVQLDLARLVAPVDCPASRWFLPELSAEAGESFIL